ncbi:MAG: hypothetical protein KAS32_28815 [Candidatus Peribacteraceae bacterium]|nr:hypothetical protein [Candidatus Peribacteraceae bacterium]
MGMRSLFGGSDERCSSRELLPGDPDPRRFRIDWVETKGVYCLAKVYYPACTTFVGKKIILFSNTTEEELRNLQYLDPHFFDDGNIVARFKPSPAGIKMARIMMKIL